MGRFQKLRRWVLTGCGVLLGLSAGCGYQFTVEGPGPVIGGGTGLAAQGPPVRLVMQTFKNNTFEPNLEFRYTRYLRRAMQSMGGAQFVEDEGSADFILEGAILSVALPSLAFSPTQTQESRVMISVGISIRDKKTGKIRWSQTSSSTAEFFVGATPTSDLPSGLQFNRVLQDRAIEQAGQLVAADLADRFLGARDQGKFQVNDGNQEKKEEEEENSDPASRGLESPELLDSQDGLAPQRPLNY